MKKQMLLTVMALLCNLSTKAQTDPCAYDKIQSLDSSLKQKQNIFNFRLFNWKEANPNINLPPTEYQSLSGGNGCTKAIYIIPVVVHVVHDINDAYGVGSNISYEQIENQINALNRSFSNVDNSAPYAVNTGIQFCLVDTTRTSSSYTKLQVKDRDLMINATNLNSFSDSRYLNIYVIDEFVNSSGNNSGIRGLGTFPSSGTREGVIMQASRFGKYDLNCSNCVIDNISEGKILAHEVGHYLGLYHTFQDSCSGMDSTSCKTEGDRCCDTPPVASENNSCNKNYYNSCYEIPFRQDMVENYMDYTPDNCRNTFTYDQTARMHFTLNTLRSSLVETENINALNLSCCIFSAHFSINNAFLCNPDSVYFEAFNFSNSPSYTWRLYDGTVLKDSHTTNDHKWSYYMNDTAIYDVELTITIGGESTFLKRKAILELKDCGNPIASTQGNWYFGSGGGLQFRENGVIPDKKAFNPNLINSNEGCITQSDSNGNLLFFGGGNLGGGPVKIYDKNYQQLKEFPNNSFKSLEGNGTTTQGLLSFPVPGDSTKYYIFSNSSSESKQKLYYNVFDLALGTAGQFSKDSTDIAIKTPSALSAYTTDVHLGVEEQLCASPKCNGEDYWLFTKLYEPINGFHQVLVFSVTSSGIKYHSRKSIAYQDYSGRFGTIKLSPDGGFLSVGKSILKFDKSTGILSDYLKITSIYENFYAASFSPNSKRFYFIGRKGYFDNDYTFYQLDLTLKDPISNAFKMASFSTSFNTMQIGPDNKIYATSEVFSDALVVIHNPNALNSTSNINAINLELYGQSLTIAGTGGISSSGLPNMIDVKKEGEYDKEINSTQYACDSVDFSSNVCCATSYAWNFGDGNSASTKNTTHKYSSNGTYYISLIVDSDTLYDTIQIGPNPITILGSGAACDTVNAFPFQSYPQSDLFNYNWSSDYGDLSILGNGGDVLVRWPQDGNLYLAVTDDKTGCITKDTLSVSVAGSISGNVIAGSAYYCDTAVSSDMLITGYTPIGGTGTFTYKWFRSANQNSWDEIPGATNKDYVHTGTKKFYYYRTAISGCQSNSPIISKEYKAIYLNIQISKLPCIGDSMIHIFDATNKNVGLNVFDYIYEYSFDSMSWTEDSINTNGSDYNKELVGNVLYIRSKARERAYCYQWSYSNVLKIQKPTFSIKTQPKDVDVCDGDCVPIFVEMENQAGIDLTYDYMFYNICGNSESSDNYSAYAELYTNGADSFRVKIDGMCNQPIYSNFAQIHYTLPGDSLYFAEQPVDYYGFNNPTFKAIPNTQYSNTSWEKSYDRGQNWEVILGENDTILNFDGTFECDSLLMLRAVLSNVCDTIVYSDTVRLFPYSGDLWMKDLWSDIGEEPFIGAINSYTHSPDIWIRYDEFDNAKHSNPWGPQSTNYQFPRHDTTNWINVTIRNNGPDSSEQARLYLHWTWASTSEEWPLNWLNTPSNQFHNQITNNDYPQGGRINHVPIYIKKLGPGDTLNINYLWDTAEVPKPGWYHHQVGNFYVHNDHIGVCFLARIETCDDSAYGMTYPEGTRLQPNAYKNNNVVSHNTVQSNLYAPGTIRAPAAIWLPIRNGWNTTVLTDIGLDFNDADYFNYSEVIAFLDDDLLAKWVQAGQTGSGYTLLSPNTLLIDNPATFTLTGLSFGVGEDAHIGFYFREKLGGGVPTGNFKKYWFEAWQQTQGKPNRDGTVSIFLDAPTSNASGGGGADGGEGGEGGGPVSGDRTIQEKRKDGDTETKATETGSNEVKEMKEKEVKEEKNILLKSEFTAYPNPFENNLTVEYTLLKDAEIEVCLTDVLGRCIIDVVPLQSQAKGSYKKSMDTQNITAGMYYIELKSEGKVFAKKLVRIN